MRRSQNGDTRFSRSGRRSGTARHASFACLAPGSGTAEKEQSGERVCRSRSGGIRFSRPGRGAAEPPWGARRPGDVCSAPTGAETGQGGAPKGRGWEWYTRYRQTAKILRINQSIFLTLVKSANYLYETRRKSALFRKGGGCMEYRGNQCSGRECALSRG